MPKWFVVGFLLSLPLAGCLQVSPRATPRVFLEPAPAPTVTPPVPTPTPTPPAGNQSSPLGQNLSAVVDYSSEWPFVDAFKASRPWISGDAFTFNNGWAIQTDENGWVRELLPNQVVRTLLFWDLEEVNPEAFPPGLYTLLYRGKGTLTFTTSWDIVSEEPGKVLFQAKPDRGGLLIHITSVDPQDYLRDIRVIMPGGICRENRTKYCTASTDSCDCELFTQNYETQIFHPLFLERLKPFKTLRFMDWLGTNHSVQSTWADRPRPDYARWNSNARGVPVEIMVELANRLSIDP